MLLRFLSVVFLCVFFVACTPEPDDGPGSSGGSSGGPPEPDPGPPPPFSTVPTSKLLTASRFLSQAGFGGTLQEIEAVASKGERAWLTEQLAIQPSLHAEQALQNHRDYCATIEDEDCDGDGVIWAPNFRRFMLWERVVNAPDQIHQKMAYALSQIFVISDVPDNLNKLPATAYWWDLLLTHGLGNYRNLLEAVTLSPAMGVYLSHYTNSKGDPDNGVFPDENYAREVMQLFSIGLYELNIDGSRKKDADGNDIPTYTNNEIRKFARVFTGLANGCGDEQEFQVWIEPAFECPMKMYEEHHAIGSKTLLNGFVVPDGQAGMQDINAALDNLYNHPNVGPFIGRLLIQRLVMSNPSPNYIQRVAAAFNDNDNGAGVRGDMKSVATAVLLDPEAGEATETSGKVRDPFMRFAHLFRALELSSKTGKYYNSGYVIQEHLQQFPLHSPSVFNFYSPDHMPFGEAGELGLRSPELQITSAFTVPKYLDDLQAHIVWDYQGEENDVDEDLVLDFSKLEAWADNAETLADYLDVLFTHGEMIDITRKGIIDIMSGLPEEPDLALRIAVYLTMASPEYIVRQ